MVGKQLFWIVTWALMLSLAISVRAQGDVEEAQIEALKQRVLELEKQNRLALHEIEELKADLQKRLAPESIEQPNPLANRNNRSSESTLAGTPDQRAQRRRPLESDVTWQELTAGSSRLQFYGFLRLDLISDSARPDFAQTPFFIRSGDPELGLGNEESNFTLHPRLTRVGINFFGPADGSGRPGKLSGKFEVDFQNGGRESRPRFRVRHAYLKVSHGAFSLLGGQTWDIISPLYPTVDNDTLLWNAGNLGDRRPQVRFTYEPRVGQGRFSFVGGLGLTGAVDSKDLDRDGVRDGETSGKPNLQSRIGYSRPLGGGGNLSLGISAHYAWEETVTLIAGRDSFRSQSLNFDYTLSFSDHIGIKGEAWFGRNLSDFRGGVGQGINSLMGTEVRSRGGWAELGLKVSKFFSVYPGFAIDDPVDRDVAVGGRLRNRVWYVVNRFQPGGPFLVGVDYLRWMTDFEGLERGTDNRVNLYLQYTF